MSVKHQGCSNFTERKEFEIEGIANMRANQFKSQFFNRRFKKVVFADIFCGSGTNVVDGNLVDGSPIRLIRGCNAAKNSGKGLDYKTEFWFSDIRKSACDLLEARFKQEFNTDLKANAVSASDAIGILAEKIQFNRNTYLFLIVDPNGPKDFPKYELEDFVKCFGDRVDIVPYISATSINRCIGARNKAGIQYSGWLSEIENFDTGFIQSLIQEKRSGWIREPASGDRQKWTAIPTFAIMKPKHCWEKSSYYDIKSEHGNKISNLLCGSIK